MQRGGYIAPALTHFFFKWTVDGLVATQQQSQSQGRGPGVGKTNINEDFEVVKRDFDVDSVKIYSNMISVSLYKHCMIITHFLWIDRKVIARKCLPCVGQLPFLANPAFGIPRIIRLRFNTNCVWNRRLVSNISYHTCPLTKVVLISSEICFFCVWSSGGPPPSAMIQDWTNVWRMLVMQWRHSSRFFGW